MTVSPWITDSPFRRAGNRLFYLEQPVHLAGIQPNNVLLPTPPEPALEVLASNGNNFFRHWMFFYPAYGLRKRRFSGDTQGEWVPLHESRAVSSPFVYIDAQKRWDLGQFNTGYFNRLRKMLSAAARYGITVEVSLFDRCGLAKTKAMPTSDQEEPDAPRWEYSPWNKNNNTTDSLIDATDNGVAEFYNTKDARLQAIQKAYIEHVVEKVGDYWNVTYEIMNEQDGGDQEARLKWADWVVSVIVARSRALGRAPRPIAFCTLKLSDPKDWRTYSGTDGYRHWSDVDIVTFHGNPRDVNPQAPADLTTYPWLAEKVFARSTDGGPDQDDEIKNGEATCFTTGHDMIFQAWTHEPACAEAIGYAVPFAPTALLASMLQRKLTKVGEDPARLDEPDGFCLRFYQDDSWVKFNESPSYTEIERGYVRRFAGTRLVLFSQTRNAAVEYRVIARNNDTIQLEREDGFKQWFNPSPVAAPAALAPLLYQWRKIEESKDNPAPDLFDLRFYADGSFATFNAGTTELSGRGEVLSVDDRTLHLNNVRTGTDTAWTYRIDGDVLTITHPNPPNHWQRFRRQERAAASSYPTLLYRWEKIAESPNNPAADVFQLRFYPDGRYTTHRHDPRADYQNGEIRSATTTQLVLAPDGVPETRVFNYTITYRPNPLKQPILRLTRVSSDPALNGTWQDFERR